MTPMANQATRREWLYALCVCLLVVLAYVFPGLGAQFHIVDDHEILRFAQGPVDLNSLLNADVLSGRFRPLYYVIRVLQVHLLGGSALAWHVMMGVIGAATCFLLYAAPRQFIRPAYALIALTTLLLFPYAPMIWVRLGPQEGIGSLLLASALLGLGLVWRGKTWGDWLFAGGAILAGFYKESFALIIPALLLLRIAMQIYLKRPLRAMLPVLLLLGLVGALQIGLIVAAYLMPNSYGMSQVAGSASRLQPLLQLLARPGGSIPLVCAGIAMFRRQKRLVLVLVGAYALWLVPQALMYGELLSERYWWPAIIGAACGLGLALEALTQVEAKRLTWIALGATLLAQLVALPNVPRQLQGVFTYTAQTRALKQAIDSALQSGKSVIAVQIAPSQQIEETWSITFHLRYAGFTGRLLLLPLTPPLPGWLEQYQSRYDQILPVGAAVQPEWHVLIFDRDSMG